MSPDQIHQEINGIKEHLVRQDMSTVEFSKDIEYIKESVVRIEKNISNIVTEKKQEHDQFRKEIKTLSDWQIKIGAKIAVWSGVGTAIGGIITSLIVWFITK